MGALILVLIIIMRRNPTLPTIRESTSAVAVSKSKQGVQSFRKIEDKINSHDEEIGKNEKIISTLANEFRLLKDQLEFEQQYSEKYKHSVGKYEEETAKQLKLIRDQKQNIAKLDHLAKEKDKALDQANKDRAQLKERCEEYTTTIEELTRDAKRKETATKQVEAQLQKARKDLKEKEAELRQKQAQIKDAFVSDRQIRESKIKKLQKDVELLNLYLESSKEQLSNKEKEVQRLGVELFQAEERMRGADKHEIKAKGLLQQIRLAQKESEDLRRKVKQLEEHNKSLEIALKTNESKNANSNNDKLKQIQQDKKELLERLDKTGKEGQEAKRRLQQQRRQRQKAQKQSQQGKERLSRLQSFAERVGKGKGEIIQQLSRLKANIQCDYCSKQLKNPVTNIPCGHSYCQECKAGYLKECKKCSGVKREAVYRNELLDEVIQAAALVEKIVTLINA